jgi:hypothetical protein
LHVDDDVAERAIGERLCALEVDDAEVLQLVASLAQGAQPLLRARPQVEREAAPERQRARGGHALQLSSAHQPGGACVLQQTLLGQPGVEIDDAVERPAAVIGHEHDVAPERARERSHRLVQDHVDARHGARRPAALPLVPADVVRMVGRHEHDHEQLGVEALRQPQRELDTLLGGAPHGVEVDAAGGSDGERVVVRERTKRPSSSLRRPEGAAKPSRRP